MLTVQDFIDRWPSPIVTRQDAARATGGLISPKLLANLDSLGEGPPEAVRHGRRVAYPAASFFYWIVSRLQPMERRKSKEVG